ncbi:hypothetical protein UPYG_G00109030 [Umbra pygmaea]|uniref:Ubiquitin-like protease family profile domain-containing protein n=1 Tax=Umbra pygmaea TaxID=75934 RepID=A0ABD0X2I8_UMBPY
MYLYFHFVIHAVLQHFKSKGVRGGQAVGKVGPYPLYWESFQSLIEDEEVSDENIICDGNGEVIGPYLEGRHWTFFHCNIKQKTITYINSLGKREARSSQIVKNWSAFATSKDCPGPWLLQEVSHSLQNDSVSCGVFTTVFAEKFLRGEGEGHIICPPIREERERLGSYLFKSLGHMLILLYRKESKTRGRNN